MTDSWRAMPRHPRQDAGTPRRTRAHQTRSPSSSAAATPELAAEIIFDEGLGDLFVIRNAGQVTSDSVLGSLEYAVGILDVPLIIVLGHDECGAVAAAIACTAADARGPAPAHREDHRRHRPVGASRRRHAAPSTPRRRRRRSRPGPPRTNHRATAGGSEIISAAVADGTLAIVGANYQLARGTRHATHRRGQYRREGISTVTAEDFRIEHDTMGEVRVPASPSTVPRPSARWRTSRSRAPGLSRPRLSRWRASSAQPRWRMASSASSIRRSRTPSSPLPTR